MASRFHGLVHGGWQPLAEEHDVRFERASARLAEDDLERAGLSRGPVRLRRDLHAQRVGLTWVAGVEGGQPVIEGGAGGATPAAQAHHPVESPVELPDGGLPGARVETVHVLRGHAGHRPGRLQGRQRPVAQRRFQPLQQLPGGVVAGPHPPVPDGVGDELVVVHGLAWRGADAAVVGDSGVGGDAGAGDRQGAAVTHELGDGVSRPLGVGVLGVAGWWCGVARVRSHASIMR